MREPWRRLAFAAAITVTVGVGAASAQTVILRNAPPGSTVELVLNVDVVGSATVDAAGTATVTSSRRVPPNKAGSDAHLYLETCDTLRRLLIVERGQPAADPGAGCTRKQVVEWFVLRRVTTLVLDLGSPTSTVWVRQGPAPEQWLREPSADGPVGRGRQASLGFMVFGSGGVGMFGDFLAIACGTAPSCGGKESPITYNAGIIYWVIPYLAFDASYMKPANLTADGSGDIYGFASFLRTDIFTFGARVGVPVGRLRVFGGAGMNYVRATFGTTQTIIPTTVIVDEIPRIIPGGTQTFDLRTTGWGWQIGGGVEAWVNRAVAVYGEAGRVMLKGKAPGGEEGFLDDRVTYVLAGLRVRIGGSRAGRK
jgi:hypothetical protein